MRGLGRCFAMVAIMLISVQLPMIVLGDTVITAEEAEVFDAGSFDDSSVWSISSTSGFSQSPAQYSMGIVADSELSFTHDRPENFGEFTAWSGGSPTSSNYSTGNPDGYYTWSRGPNITVNNFQFTGMHSMILTNISLVIHFEIPDALYSDTVRIILGGTGSEKLVKTYTRTLSGVYKMSNPLVIPMDEHAQWDWGLAEQSYITVDYVSQGGGSDDSEVRIDAVGLKAKFLQPWYSFENVKAIHELSGMNGIPIIDINPYQGTRSNNLDLESCGLANNGENSGFWDFDIERPPFQSLGRIHVFGTSNYTIWTPSNDADGEYIEIQSGELLENQESLTEIRIEIRDGCISGVRVDINDPHIVINGSIIGNISGLSQSGSSVRFAVGDFLIDTLPISLGEFSITAPVGHALPGASESVDVGASARFQWASDGSPETVVIHIDSMSITGGYVVEWDRDPQCIGINDLELVEDGGGILIPLSVTCTDDITLPDDLTVRATSSEEGIVSVYSEGSSLIVQPVSESHGSSQISIAVEDQRGNVWTDYFQVSVSEVKDPPSIEGLPMNVYVEIGERVDLDIIIYDPDTENPSVSSSRSWAIFTDGILSLSPVETGVHPVEIVVSDGTSQYSQIIDVIVTSKSDLLVETISISNSATGGSEMTDGQIGRIVAYVRNQGMGDAGAVEIRCYIDDILVGTSTIGYISPGGLEEIQCDAVFQGPATQMVRIEVDSSGSILETDEGNNIKEVEIAVGGPTKGTDGGNQKDDQSVFLAISIGLIMICFAAIQVGPGRVRKPFNKSRK